MTITVGDIYGQFPNFSPKDMIALMNGRTDFNGSDKVSLANIARFNGSLAMELSVFVAGREGKSYTNLLATGMREQVTQAAGIKENKNLADNNSVKDGKSKNIPMDTSVFDVARDGIEQYSA